MSFETAEGTECALAGAALYFQVITLGSIAFASWFFTHFTFSECALMLAPFFAVETVLAPIAIIGFFKKAIILVIR